MWKYSWELFSQLLNPAQPWRDITEIFLLDSLTLHKHKETLLRSFSSTSLLCTTKEEYLRSFLSTSKLCTTRERYCWDLSSHLLNSAQPHRNTAEICPLTFLMLHNHTETLLRSFLSTMHSYAHITKKYCRDLSAKLLNSAPLYITAEIFPLNAINWGSLPFTSKQEAERLLLYMKMMIKLGNQLLFQICWCHQLTKTVCKSMLKVPLLMLD